MAMAYPDYGASAAAGGMKRPRTDAPKTEGDWVCPNCGNNNFAFRTTCNMRKCGASKPNSGVPDGLPQRGQILTPHYEPAPPIQYVGAPGQGGGPPLATYGAPTYATAIPTYNGQPSPYGMSTYSSHLAMAPAPMPYNAPSLYGPPPQYIAQPAYPGMDPYGGAPLELPSLQRLPLPLPIPYEDPSRKRRGVVPAPENADGDWMCASCGNNNFAFRTTCNMRKCGAARPGPGPPTVPDAGFYGAAPAAAPARREDPPPEGAWSCKLCGNVNWPFRSRCNRRNCGAEKDAVAPAGEAGKEGGGAVKAE